MGARLYLRAFATVLSKYAGDSRSPTGYFGRAVPRQAGPIGDDRPHLPRRLHCAGQPCRAVLTRERGRTSQLQLLRLTPWEPRSYDAGHVRKRAAPQPARARN